VNTLDIDTPPNPEISFQTVLDAVNRQSQEIEVKGDAKISQKIMPDIYVMKSMGQISA
jgi:hypothetical protein